MSFYDIKFTRQGFENACCIVRLCSLNELFKYHTMLFKRLVLSAYNIEYSNHNFVDYTMYQVIKMG